MFLCTVPKRILAVVAAVLLTLLVGPVALAQQRSTAKESFIIRMTNDYRAANGLPRLQYDSQLAQAAHKHARNMARQERTSHELDGKRVRDRVRAEGYNYAYVGENVGWNRNYSRPATAMMQSWKDSLGHNQNLLSRNFTEIGVGAYRNSDGTWYFCQVFGKPQNSTSQNSDTRRVIVTFDNRTNRTISYTLEGKSFSLRPGYWRRHTEYPSSGRVKYGVSWPDQEREGVGIGGGEIGYLGSGRYEFVYRNGAYDLRSVSR